MEETENLKKYKITGDVENNEEGERTNEKLEIGSIQEVPASLGDSWVEKGLAEVISDETED